MVRWWSAARSLLVAAVVVAAAMLAVAVVHRHGEPPISPEAARVRADVTVMPNPQVASFLRAQGVTGAALRVGGGTAVVAHVTWTPVRPAEDARYEVFLAGGQCRAGVFDSYAGVPDGAASLGFDGRWNDRLERTVWLRADAAVRTGGGYDSVAQSVSVPASYGGVWAVGRVIDGCAVSETPALPHAVADPQPVVGVGLTTRDRIWWLTRAGPASASGEHGPRSG